MPRGQGLEFPDDFAGPLFRRAADRAAGDAGAHGVERIDTGAQHALDGGDEMKNLGEPLELHEAGDGDAAVFANATEVVALEIGDHDEFGLLLGIGLQFEGELLVAHGDRGCGDACL